MRKFSRVLYLLLALSAVTAFSGCGPTHVKVSGQQVQLEGAGFWDRRRLRPFFEDVRILAFEYARRNKLELRCERMPDVTIVRNSEQLEKMTGLPAKRENMKLHGACDYRANRIYTLSPDQEVLAHELGHWYLSETEEIADDFMDFVKKNRAQVAKIAKELGPLPASFVSLPANPNATQTK
jgi:hypothetical protein